VSRLFATSHTVQHDRAGGQQTRRGEQRRVANSLDTKPATNALIDKRAVDEAIADDPRPAGEGGSDYLLHDLSTRSGKQQRLSSVAHLYLWVEQKCADTFAELGPARLTTLHNLKP